MSFPQLGYPQYLSPAGPGAYGGERPGVLAAAAAAAAAASSGRPGAAELGAGAGAAAVTSVLGMYAAAGPYAGAPNYSAFLPYAADLSLFSQMVSEPGLLGAQHAARVPGPGSRVPGQLGAREARAGAGSALPAGPRRCWPRALEEAGRERPRHAPREAGRWEARAAQGVLLGVGRPREQARGARPALEVGANLARRHWLGGGGAARPGLLDAPSRPAGPAGATIFQRLG